MIYWCGKMSVLNILCFSDESFARELGKKTDERDVESYIYKEQRGDVQDALTFLRPRKHPEKMRPLLGSLDIADAAIIEIKKIDASIGEILVASSVAGIERGLVVINPEEGGWVDPEQIKKILEQAGLKSWKINEQFNPPQRGIAILCVGGVGLGVVTHPPPLWVGGGSAILCTY